MLSEQQKQALQWDLCHAALVSAALAPHKAMAKAEREGRTQGCPDWASNERIRAQDLQSSIKEKLRGVGGMQPWGGVENAGGGRDEGRGDAVMCCGSAMQAQLTPMSIHRHPTDGALGPPKSNQQQQGRE